MRLVSVFFWGETILGRADAVAEELAWLYGEVWGRWRGIPTDDGTLTEEGRLTTEEEQKLLEGNT